MSAATGEAGFARGCLIEGQSNAGKSTLAGALVEALGASGCPARLRRVTMTDAPVLDELHRLSLDDFDGWTPELALRRFNVCQSARLMVDAAGTTEADVNEDYPVYDRGWWGQLLFNDFFTPDGQYLPVNWMRTAPRFQTRVYLFCARHTRAERSLARRDPDAGRLQVLLRDDIDRAAALDAAALARIEREGGWFVYDTGASPLHEIVDDLVRAIVYG